jgi:transposase
VQLEALTNEGLTSREIAQRLGRSQTAIRKPILQKEIGYHYKKRDQSSFSTKRRANKRSEDAASSENMVSLRG